MNLAVESNCNRFCLSRIKIDVFCLVLSLTMFEARHGNKLSDMRLPVNVIVILQSSRRHFFIADRDGK